MKHPLRSLPHPAKLQLSPSQRILRALILNAQMINGLFLPRLDLPLLLRLPYLAALLVLCAIHGCALRVRVALA